MSAPPRSRPQQRRKRGPKPAVNDGTATPVLPSGVMTPVMPGTITPTTANKAATTTRFADFPLVDQLKRSIPFEFCTEVQAATLPAILAGKDVLAQAKTGTGKTLAFLVPAIQRLMTGPQPAQAHTSVLVLSPTRELAQQIGDSAKVLFSNSPFGVQCVVGGTNINTDIKNLKNQRADILVATPGRLLDLIDNAGLKDRLSRLQNLTLDEADRLLDQGFRPELLKILQALPDRKVVDRQTLLFSATLPAQVHSISSIALKTDHEFISTLKDEDVNVHEHVVQDVLVVPGQDIVAATIEVLKREEALSGERGGFKVMVFLPTARAAGLHFDLFSALGLWPVWQIHSRMSQPKRTRSTDEFRAAPRGVLFSSDVTARGIDVEGVTAVVQVGLPSSSEQYVHRLGRTARAGAKGHGILVLSDFETFFLQDRVMKTFPLQPLPQPDLSSSRALAAQALANVSDEAKVQSYQAWLGYYNSNLRNLRWSQTDLVREANHYARDVLRTDAGGGEWRPPALQAKTVGKMGLKGVPGLNVERGAGGGGGGNPRGGKMARPNAGGGFGGGQGGFDQQQQGQQGFGGAQGQGFGGQGQGRGGGGGRGRGGRGGRGRGSGGGGAGTGNGRYGTRSSAF